MIKSFSRLVVLSVLGLFVVAFTFAGGSKEQSSQTATAAASSKPVTLTLWQNLGQGNQAQVIPVLISAFEKLHPNITVNNVQQPRANYFALLQAAAVSQSGPDMVNMWTGLFTMQYKLYLENLKGLVPASDLANVVGTEWSSVGFNSPGSPYVMPLQVQFYIGFYNKKLFQQAGLDPNVAPTTWDQLFADCAKIKASGVTCIQQGTQNLSGEFYPWYDLTYMMAGVLSPQQWEGLYNGKVQWTDPAVKSQIEKWHKLYTDGYVNQDALTATNVMQPFMKGQAAMIIKINNDAGPFTDALGSDVGIFIPPFSDTPVKGVDEFAGNGLAITSYSPNKAAAAEFIKFLTTQQAGQIVADGGLIPAVKGVGPTNQLAKDMVALVNDRHLAVYPMLDNVLPPSFVDVGTTVFPSILVGGVSVDAGLSKMSDAWKKLPASERGSS
ncbi:MAG TPA: ABC transporter substrate-binding protein, partial [Spirochaetia bacterium]|nr:ABC transporter substrate-binding protein [Spirochaetia bacterium]